MPCCTVSRYDPHATAWHPPPPPGPPASHAQGSWRCPGKEGDGSQPGHAAACATCGCSLLAPAPQLFAPPGQVKGGNWELHAPSAPPAPSWDLAPGRGSGVRRRTGVQGAEAGGMKPQSHTLPCRHCTLWGALHPRGSPILAHGRSWLPPSTGTSGQRQPHLLRDVAFHVFATVEPGQVVG